MSSDPSIKDELQLCPWCGGAVPPPAVVCGACRTPLKEAGEQARGLSAKRIGYAIAMVAMLVGALATLLPVHAYIGVQGKNCGSVLSAYLFDSHEGPSCADPSLHRLRGIAAATAAVALPALGLPHLFGRLPKPAIVLVALYSLVLVYGATVWADRSATSREELRSAQAACINYYAAFRHYPTYPDNFVPYSTPRSANEEETTRNRMALIDKAEMDAKSAARTNRKYEEFALALSQIGPRTGPGDRIVASMCVRDERWN